MLDVWVFWRHDEAYWVMALGGSEAEGERVEAGIGK